MSDYCYLCKVKLDSNNSVHGFGLCCTKRIDVAFRPHEIHSVTMTETPVCKKCKPKAVEMNEKFGIYIQQEPFQGDVNSHIEDLEGDQCRD